MRDTREELTRGVVVVVHRQGRYLLIRRSAQVVAPGAWCFVGGAIQPGESESDAVVREFAEEVGARVQPVRQVWEWLRPGGTLQLYWWEGVLLQDELRPNPDEVAEIRWCTPAEMLRLPDLLESNRAFLAAQGFTTTM